MDKRELVKELAEKTRTNQMAQKKLQDILKSSDAEMFTED